MDIVNLRGYLNVVVGVCWCAFGDLYIVYNRKEIFYRTINPLSARLGMEG
jgi:hypothetical protein